MKLILSPSDRARHSETSKPRAPLLYWICLFCSAFLFQGCLIIPIQKHDDKILQGTPVGTNLVHQVTLGVSNTNDVAKLFGKPDAIWQDENVYIYWWVSRKAEVFWVLVGTTGMAGGSVDVGRNNVLFAKFDREGKLTAINSTVRGEFESVGHHLLEWRDSPGKTTNRPATKPLAPSTVIFQLRATAEGQPVETLTKRFWGKAPQISSRNLKLGVGTFNSGGLPVRMNPRPLKESGWYSLTLPPGRYYLGVEPGIVVDANVYAMAVDHGPRFQLDIPKGQPLIYAGSIELECSIGKYGIVRNSVSWVDSKRVQIVNRLEAAQALESVRNQGNTLSVELVRHHTGPYLLLTPSD